MPSLSDDEVHRSGERAAVYVLLWIFLGPPALYLLVAYGGPLLGRWLRSVNAYFGW